MTDPGCGSASILPQGDRKRLQPQRRQLVKGHRLAAANQARGERHGRVARRVARTCREPENGDADGVALSPSLESNPANRSAVARVRAVRVRNVELAPRSAGHPASRGQGQSAPEGSDWKSKPEGTGSALPWPAVAVDHQFRQVAQRLPIGHRPRQGNSGSGGRRWWTHPASTGMNISRIIFRIRSRRPGRCGSGKVTTSALLGTD